MDLELHACLAILDLFLLTEHSSQPILNQQHFSLLHLSYVEHAKLLIQLQAHHIKVSVERQHYSLPIHSLLHHLRNLSNV